VNVLKKYFKSKLSVKQRLVLKSIYNIFMKPGKWEKNINDLKFALSMYKDEYIHFLPPVMAVSVTDNCNLRCPSCLFLLENEQRFFHSFISVEKFRKVLETYNKDKKAQVIFLGGGEPLMHPEIEKLIDICREFNLSPKTSTNGILLKDKVPALKKLEHINVSLDSYDYASFKKYRGGTPKQFDAIMEGLKILKGSGISFSISFVLSTENVTETSRMLELGREIKPDLFYFHNINPHGSDHFNSLCIDDLNTKVFLNNVTNKNDYDFDIFLPVIFDTRSPLFLKSQCMQPWNYFCCNSVGDLSYCCHLAADKTIGNVFEGYDFNSPKMVELRKFIISRKFPPEIMKSCLYCQRRFMGEEYGWFDSKAHKWFIYK